VGGAGRHGAKAPFRKILNVSGVPVVAVTTQVTDEATVRREYIAGLRRLAELEERPGIPTPYKGNHHPKRIVNRTHRIGSETCEQVELVLDERRQVALAEGGAR
jgi:hypothetical protein